MKELEQTIVTPSDEARLRPHITGGNTMHPWFKTNPSEKDLAKAIMLEARGNGRVYMLRRLISRYHWAVAQRFLKKYAKSL